MQFEPPNLISLFYGTANEFGAKSSDSFIVLFSLTNDCPTDYPLELAGPICESVVFFILILYGREAPKLKFCPFRLLCYDEAAD